LARNLGDVHDLFLIEDDPVCLLENRLQGGMGVLDPGLLVLALDEVRDHPAFQRTRPVEGQEGDDVLETVGSEIDQHPPHARAFQLEDAVGLPPAEQFVSLEVVQGQRIQVRNGFAAAARQLQRVLLITVKVLSPRKSNLISPTSSTFFMSYWVTTSPFLPL
jgi:hypothetical protein